MQDLENAASGDATVRQKIASLPQEVQDVSLLEKITGEKLECGRKMREEEPICSTSTEHQTLGHEYVTFHVILDALLSWDL